MRQFLHTAAIRFLVFLALTMPAGAGWSNGQWSAFVALGAMTTNTWHEALTPGQTDFAGSGILAGGVTWERPIGGSRYRWGVEAILLGHTGRQDHFELSVPVVLRYVPRRSRAITSVAAGLGLSYATKVPQVEIDRNGASQRLYVHWMAEVEFATRRTDLTTFFRVHHRSDGYGLFEVDAGSTGLLVGLRRSF